MRRGQIYCLLPQYKRKQFINKQADKKLTAKTAGDESGVTQVTYKKLRDGGEVKPIITKKNYAVAC